MTITEAARSIAPALSAINDVQLGSGQQLTFGPSEAVKPRPTIARLRGACDDLGIHGTTRLVAYELLSYWEPGGTVFPSMKVLARCLQSRSVPNRAQPRTTQDERKDECPARVVRRHVHTLERVGLWKRVARSGCSNIYELHLPGDPLRAGVVKQTPRTTESAPPGLQSPPEVTNEVKEIVRSSVPTQLSTGRTRCSTCKRSWPAQFGTDCHHCDNQPQQHSIPATGPNWQPRIRNCPQCHALDREHEDTCAHCDWTRAAWERSGKSG